MLKTNSDDRTSLLKQFLWEELDQSFFVVVLLRNDRRVFAEKHFEEQLFNVRSPFLQEKWRRIFVEFLVVNPSNLRLTENEAQLLNEISRWHLNQPSSSHKYRSDVDVLLDFDRLIDASKTIVVDRHLAEKIFDFQPMKTLQDASKIIQLWTKSDKKSEEKHFLSFDELSSPKKQKTSSSTDRPPTEIDCSSTGWIQLDSKVVPYVTKECDRLLPVDFLVKERILNVSEDLILRPFYIPLDKFDVDHLNQLIRQINPSTRFTLNEKSLSITLDHLIFRLKRLFFIRFLWSPVLLDNLNFQRIMSFEGGLITYRKQVQRIPFIDKNKKRYIPHVDLRQSTKISTFIMASRDEVEYFRLVASFEYLSNDENPEYLNRLFAIENLMLLPIDLSDDKDFSSILSFQAFHYNEYRRRRKQQKIIFENDDLSRVSAADGWWQTPVSSDGEGTSISHLKWERPILF